MMWRITALLFAGGVLALALFGTKAAGPLEDAESAFHRGDYAAAVQIFRSLAEGGDAGAQYSLGWMYATGEGIPRNDKQALFWFRKAAEQGNIKAQSAIAGMYSFGVGVPTDYVLAYMWANVAAARERNAARHDMDVKLRDDAAARMTPDQIAEAQRLASEWK